MTRTAREQLKTPVSVTLNYNFVVQVLARPDPD